MNKILKIMFSFTVLIFGMISLSGCTKENKTTDKINIISTSFPGYDFARAITKDSKNINVSMLLKPGAEMHDFEPTPNDIKNIKNADMFIYVGGDSDEWIKKVLKDIDTKKVKVIKLMDLVDLQEEELIEGMEDDEEKEEEEIEYDEHIWTSPVNAISIINSLKEEITKIDKKQDNLYQTNADSYINELKNIDSEIKEVVKNATRKEIIFGDRFPLRYFTNEYGLTYYAAFPGCSEQTEASAKTIAFLINKVKEDKVPVVFHIELSNGKIADTIAKETGTKVLEFNSAHNISQKDFDAGVTYVDIMNNNIKVLKEALN